MVLHQGPILQSADHRHDDLDKRPREDNDSDDQKDQNNDESTEVVLLELAWNEDLCWKFLRLIDKSIFLCGFVGSLQREICNHIEE